MCDCSIYIYIWMCAAVHQMGKILFELPLKRKKKVELISVSQNISAIQNIFFNSLVHTFHNTKKCWVVKVVAIMMSMAPSFIYTRLRTNITKRSCLYTHYLTWYSISQSIKNMVGLDEDNQNESDASL